MSDFGPCVICGEHRRREGQVCRDCSPVEEFARIMDGRDHATRQAVYHAGRVVGRVLLFLAVVAALTVVW